MTDQPTPKPGDRRTAPQEPYHTPADEALTAKMIARAPSWMAGTAGVLRVLLKDSVVAIGMLGGLLFGMNSMNQNAEERRHDETVKQARDQIAIAKDQVIAAQAQIEAVVGLRTSVEALRNDVGALQVTVEGQSGRIDRLEGHLDVILEDHPNAAARAKRAMERAQRQER